ncbi:MAG: sulfotransferase [Elusimicrobiota bacterium]
MIIIEKPIFVFTLHRSGSTYIKNIIDFTDEVKMLEDEVHFDHPFFFNTFRKYYHKYCKDNPGNYNYFLDVITDKKLRGAFWEHYKNRYNNFYDSKKYLNEADKITVWESFDSILRQVLKDSKKKRIGIKYPAHHKYYKDFRKQYPHAKNIFLVRDPRAITASKIISPTNNRLKNKGKIIYEAVRMFTIFYFIIEFNSFAKTIINDNSVKHIIKYENIVSNKKKQIKDLCDFAEINFRSDMLHVKGKQSGYNNQFNIKNKINRWTIVLRKYERTLINFFTKKYRQDLGYE